MAISVQQVLKDAQKLASRLKDYEASTDTMLAKAQNLNKTVETMKEYHEDMQSLSSVSHQMPRSSLIVTIQRESKQLRLLENENRELRSALEDHQFALELVMSKYRQQVTQLIKSRNSKDQALDPHTDANNEIIRRQSEKIWDMTAVMRKAVEVDESSSLRDKEVLAQLKLENEGLRDLLKIARKDGPAINGYPTLRFKDKAEKEVQTEDLPEVEEEQKEAVNEVVEKAVVDEETEEREEAACSWEVFLFSSLPSLYVPIISRSVRVNSTLPSSRRHRFSESLPSIGEKRSKQRKLKIDIYRKWAPPSGPTSVFLPATRIYSRVARQETLDTTDGQRSQGGTASRCPGGKDDPPSRPKIVQSIGNRSALGFRRPAGLGTGKEPPSSLSSSSSDRPREPREPSKWIPPSSVKRDVVTPEERNHAVFRRVRGILNKITPEKFEKLSEELLALGLNTTSILKGVIILIFEKALEEPKYSSMYAQLCNKLSQELNRKSHDNSSSPPKSDSSASSNSSACNEPTSSVFCRLLLAKCKDEFENRTKASEAFGDGPLPDDGEEQRSLAKQKMLGNIKFICELGRQRLVLESILHLCIQQLSKKRRDETFQNKAEDLECLCQIMKTVGRLLDTEKAKQLMDQYFDRMRFYAQSPELPSRIRFMLQDVLELRANKWVPRRVQREQNPKTIGQIREEAAKDFGLYFPGNTLHGFTGIGYGANFAGGFPVRNPTFPHGVPGQNTRPGQRALDDMMSYYPGLGSLGTGPGAIQDSNFFSMVGSNNRRGGTPMGGSPLQRPSPVPSPSPLLNNSSNSSNNYPLANQANRGNYQYRGSSSLQDRRPDREREIGRNQAINSANNIALMQPTPAQAAAVGARAVGDVPPRFRRQQPTPLPPSQQPPQQQQRAVPVTPGAQPSPPSQSSPPGKGLTLSSHFNSMGDANIDQIILKPNMGFSKPMGPTIETSLGTLKIEQVQHPIFPKSNNRLNSPHGNDNNNVTQIKNNGPNQSNKEVILKKAEEALEDFITDQANLEDIIIKMKDLKIPKNFQADVLVTIMKKSLDKGDGDRESASKLMTQLKSENVIGSNVFITAFKNVLNKMSEIEADIPRVKSYLGGFIARAIADEMMDLKEAYELVEGGQHYPLFLLCLQQLHQTQSQAWLTEAFVESKLNLMLCLPEIDRKKERLADILHDRGLGFLYPLLRIESDLWKQINACDCTPASLYRWIKENVDISLHTAPGFVSVLFICVAKYITEKAKQAASEATFNEGQSPNGTTSVTDHEKDLLTKYNAVFQAFFTEKPVLQLVALYALQSYCYDLSFPKGMMLRWFIMLYDLEVVEEEVFLKWKEDINDEYPGKGQALFQVNQWLTWLEEAEEEEEDEEDVSDSPK